MGARGRGYPVWYGGMVSCPGGRGEFTCPGGREVFCLSWRGRGDFLVSKGKGRKLLQYICLRGLLNVDVGSYQKFLVCACYINRMIDGCEKSG